MASLDNLSDAEIRVKLTELGYPVGPITSTTRKVLLKKLKYLYEQGKSSGSDKKDVKNRSSLSRYSSEEESEDDNSSSRRRKSMPPPPPPKSPPKTVKRRSLGRQTQDDELNNLEDHNTLSDFRHPSASSTLNSNSDTNNIFSGFRNHKYSPKNISSQSPPSESKFSSFMSKYSGRTSKEVDTGSDTDGMDEFDNKTSGNKSSIYSLFPSSSGGASTARSRFHPQTLSTAIPSSNSEPLRFSSKASGLNSDINNSPFSSDFVRRLTAASSYKSGE